MIYTLLLLAVVIIIYQWWTFYRFNRFVMFLTKQNNVNLDKSWDNYWASKPWDMNFKEIISE